MSVRRPKRAKAMASNDDRQLPKAHEARTRHPAVNSVAYWDKRFGGDWQSKDGRAQSAFFSHVALDHMPDWLVDEIRRDKLSICDWGCALGDGSDVLSMAFPESRISGFDFSEVAIRDAAARFEHITFSTNAPDAEHGYDIVFSSNVLEHFAEPYGEAAKMAQAARRYVIALVPFYDVTGTPEHVTVFSHENIPVSLEGGFALVFFKEIDTSALPSTQWPGRQALMVFAHRTSSEMTAGERKVGGHRSSAPSSNGLSSLQRLAQLYLRLGSIQESARRILADVPGGPGVGPQTLNVAATGDPEDHFAQLEQWTLDLRQAVAVGEARFASLHRQGIEPQAQPASSAAETRSLRAEIERLHQVMTERDRQAAAAQSELHRVNTLMEQQGAQYQAELDRVTALMGRQVTDFQAELDRVNALMEQQGAQYQAELDRVTAQMSRQVTDFQAELDRVNALMTRQQADFESKLQRVQGAAGEQIALLEREVRAGEAELSASRMQIEASRQRVATLQDEVETARSAVDRVSREADARWRLLTEQSRQLDRNNDDLARWRWEAQQAGQALAERENEVSGLRRDIEALRASRSWRFAAPLRVGTTGARSAFRAAGRGGFFAGRFISRQLPLSPETKQRLRSSVFARLAAPALVTERSAEAAPALPTEPPAEAAPATSDQPDVFVWAIIDWHFRIQRPQHLSRGLAKKRHRVFYFSNAFIASPEPGFQIEQIEGAEHLYVVRLHVEHPPSIYFAAAPAAAADGIRASLGRFLKWSRSRAILSLVQHPFWSEFADIVPNRRLIYDLMDHHEGFGDEAPEILALEARLLRDADHVVVTSDYLEKIARSRNASVSMVRNAGEFSHFAQRPAQVYRDPDGRRVLGYYGAIADWFDVDLVERVAERFPDHTVLLVGADTAGVADKLRHRRNVRFTGEVKYVDLPFYLYAFDVCLLPFRVNALTLATNPVKCYEYLSAGKPVVSVDLPELAHFANLVARAKTYDEFLATIERELADEGDGQRMEARKSFAAGQTWDHRVDALVTHLAASPTPRVSVIVVTFGNLDFTKACLASLETHSAYANLEIIVVDNASRDGTPAFLKAWQESGTDRTVILNSENRGFSAANNQGLRAASGDYLVLLNNDTYVTAGWIGTLIGHLKRNPGLGMIGPVTNNIGNEARITINYSSMSEMAERALAYTSAHIGQIYPMATVAFFCVAMPRSIHRIIGDLDETFGTGFFEDDDYCRRLQGAGLEVACAEDVFIHHHSSASFNTMAAEARRALFETNKARYEEKWGSWIHHQYRP